FLRERQARVIRHQERRPRNRDDGVAARTLRAHAAPGDTLQETQRGVTVRAREESCGGHFTLLIAPRMLPLSDTGNRGKSARVAATAGGSRLCAVPVPVKHPDDGVVPELDEPPSWSRHPSLTGTSSRTSLPGDGRERNNHGGSPDARRTGSANTNASRGPRPVA